jgi:S1-C subfamily serine protease
MTLSESTRGVLASLSTDLASAVQRAGRSIVAVHGRRRFPASGLAWSPDQVITAAHVLERDTDLSITAPDGTQHAANLVGRDPGADLAILAIPGAPLQPIERSSETLAAGNLVLAVGRPGTPEPIASFGAISSVGGAWRTAQGGLLDAYVRADVALLPGLSGGALADVQVASSACSAPTWPAATRSASPRTASTPSSNASSVARRCAAPISA